MRPLIGRPAELTVTLVPALTVPAPGANVGVAHGEPESTGGGVVSCLASWPPPVSVVPVSGVLVSAPESPPPLPLSPLQPVNAKPQASVPASERVARPVRHLLP